MRRFVFPILFLLAILSTFFAGSQLGLFDHPATAAVGEAEDKPADFDKIQRILELEHELADLKLLVEVKAIIKAFHLDGEKLTTEELLSAAAKGMTDALDEYSSFQTKEEVVKFEESLRGDYAGIGAYVNVTDGFFTIARPIYSGPAYSAGLRSRDRIVEVNGVSIIDKKLEESVQMLRGKPGTDVIIKVVRSGWTKPREMTITRAKVKIDSVKHQMLPGKIGLVRIYRFGTDTARDLERALVDLEKDHMVGLILDVRDNGGGWYKAAQLIVDKFLEEGKLIVYSAGRKGVEDRKDVHATDHSTHPNYPVVVLVNKFSASASEILAGSLQDHKRAVVVGETTYGKGSVQRPLEMQSRKGAKLILTIAQYHLPSGRSIHKVGVKPDIAVAEAEALEWWELQQIQNLLDKKVFEAYAKERYDAHKVLLHELAEYDGKDASRYPDFDKWYATLDTKAQKNTVRRYLREHLRMRISDDRRQEFFYNLQEDLQLQSGILSVLKKLEVDPKKIAEYKFFAETDTAKLNAPVPTSKEKAPAHP